MLKCSDETCRIPFQDAAICMVMLERTPPHDKLKCMFVQREFSHIAVIFNIFDSNSDGFLSVLELQGMVEHVNSSAISLGHISSTLVKVCRPWALANPAACDSSNWQDLAHISEQLDQNKDGRVSLEEWLQYGADMPALMVLLGLEGPRAMVASEGAHDVCGLSVHMTPAFITRMHV